MRIAHRIDSYGALGYLRAPRWGLVAYPGLGALGYLRAPRWGLVAYPGLGALVGVYCIPEMGCAEGLGFAFIPGNEDPPKILEKLENWRS